MITNYHVITDASEIQVTFQGGTEYSAKVVGFDQDKDIAVLKVCLSPLDKDRQGRVGSLLRDGWWCGGVGGGGGRRLDTAIVYLAAC